MAVQNKQYLRGFDAGQIAGSQKGIREGLNGSAARIVMERDLIHIYGEMAIVLTEKHHWSQDAVEDLIMEIQEQWRNILSEGIGDYESMADIVERRTGISLRQAVQDILDGGWE